MSLSETRDNVKRQETTEDAFLGGRLTLTQPATGFRAGLDSVLLGAAVRAMAGTVLDLGAGVGTAGLSALALEPALGATLVETDPQMAALARHNIAANRFADRAVVAELDLTAHGQARIAAGLKPDHYVAVIANPPFYSGGTLAKAGRDKARGMPEAALDRWVAVAASHCAPEGDVIFIHLAAALPALLASVSARFGAITVLPLSPRAGEAAHRVLVRGIKGSRAPFTLLATRPLHSEAGRGFVPAFDAIFRGQGRLDW